MFLLLRVKLAAVASLPLYTGLSSLSPLVLSSREAAWLEGEGERVGGGQEKEAAASRQREGERPPWLLLLVRGMDGRTVGQMEGEEPENEGGGKVFFSRPSSHSVRQRYGMGKGLNDVCERM